jgi:hypothetical protein
MISPTWLYLAFLAQQVPPPYSWKELDQSVKPLMPIAVFKHLPIISASEVLSKKGGYPLRVFRYTYKADLDSEIRRLKTIFKKSDGWTFYAAKKPGELAAFDRRVKKGPLRSQTVLFNAGKWVRQDGARGNAIKSFPAGEKWIKISYNEESSKKLLK